MTVILSVNCAGLTSAASVQPNPGTGVFPGVRNRLISEVGAFSAYIVTAASDGGR